MPRVSDEHRASRREQILAAGWRCVAREGFHKTSMADVIRESGLSAGAVYPYFRSKDEIIAAIAEKVVAGADAIFDEVLASDSRRRCTRPCGCRHPDRAGRHGRRR